MDLKKRLRFGLRTFLVFCIVLGTCFAFWGSVVQRYQIENAMIEELTHDCAASSIVRGGDDFTHLLLT